VRHTLGIDAFGINAFRAEHEGELVVKEHSDSPRRSGRVPAVARRV